MPEETRIEPKRLSLFPRFRAFLRRTFGIKSYFELGKIRPPLLICFDHLYSEYLTVRHRVVELPNAVCQPFVDDLPAKRADGTLSWSDLYHFQLILAEVLPAEQLRTKIRRLRFDYRSVAGEKEFDDYMAAKPPDLQSPPQPTEDQSESHYEKLLRDDLKDLLGRMYLEYAILPVREERLTDLTWVAARLCLFSLICLLGILGILFFVPLVTTLFDSSNGAVPLADRFQALRDAGKLASMTVFVVVISGAMGGFVSALQRIQSQPAEGDSLYNLSLLFHGSYSVFVSPITGGIFAILLYLLFTSGTLSGTFFPTIYSPSARYVELSQAVLAPTPKPSPTPSPQATASPVATATITPSDPAGTIIERPAASPFASPQVGPTVTPSVAPSVIPSVSPSPTQDTPATSTQKAVPQAAMDVYGFLAESGPARGQDYALLIVWCFIAGFAERFVPDTLDRLVRGNASGKK